MLDSIGDNHFTGAGSDLAPMAKAMSSLFGSTVIFGLGGSGKTRCAESFLSVYHTSALEDGFRAKAHDAVVSAVLKSWMNPAFFQAAIDAGIIVGQDANDWAKIFIQDLEIGSLGSVYALCAKGSTRAADDFTKRLKLAGFAGADAMEAVNPDEIIKAPVYKIEIDDLEYIATHLVGVASERTSLVVAFPVDHSSAPSRMLPRMPEGAERCDVDELVDVLLPIMEKSRFAIDKGAPESWFCAQLGFNNFRMADKVENHPMFTKGEGVDICITQKGIQARIPDDVDAYQHHEYIPFEDWMIELLSSRFSDADAKQQTSKLKKDQPDDIFRELLEEGGITLLSIMAESGVIDAAVSRSAAFSAVAHEHLADLVEDLRLVQKPSLVMTEMKAVSGYGAVAYNKNIEQKGVEIELKFAGSDADSAPRSIIRYSADCSLVTAAVGSLLLWPVTHVSVLDLTLAFDIVFNSSTQKGGLDSSMLHMMQYLSNIATMANAHFVVETRDDFTTSQNEAEASERARTTLGANSRIAVQISGSGSSPRSIWARVKGGDDVEDCWIELFTVTQEDYPENVIRVKGKRPSFTNFMQGK